MMLNGIYRSLLLTAGAVYMATTTTGAEAADAQTHTNNAVLAVKALNAYWYNIKTGLWDEAWWNSANALTTLADFAAIRLTEANKLNIGGYMRHTFVQAQKINVKTLKTMSKSGMVSSSNCFDVGNGCMSKREFVGKRGFENFINEYYDDEGWWALAWIKAYDVSRDKEYLAAAINLFNDMQGGKDTPCGGIWWRKQRDYVNAIANELYLAVAASLARRVPENKYYKEIAISQWNWFEKSGMINDKNLIQDGLTKECKGNGLQTWSYNQGVVLGGLADLFRLTKDVKYVEKATVIARAAIKALSQNGTLVEVDKCEFRPGNCGADGSQFKGIFIRNLRYLNDVAPQQEFKDFIIANADSIWAKDRNEENRLGIGWTGPYIKTYGAAHSSALDALVAAVAVS